MRSQEGGGLTAERRTGPGVDDDDLTFSIWPVHVCRDSPLAPWEPRGPTGICEWIQVRNRCRNTHAPWKRCLGVHVHECV